MIYCKKHIIATCFGILLPLTSWSEPIVVDDSDNFAIIDGQQVRSSAGHPKYDELPDESQTFEKAHQEQAQMEGAYDEGPALVSEDAIGEPENSTPGEFNDHAKLIEKIQTLQQALQELRGQLEVQAHDLKLLQQQQVAFYKDLDARLSAVSGKPLQPNASADLTPGLGAVATKANPVAVQAPTAQTTKTQPVGAAVSKNPADEQISYMAAYELVKNKKYDEAINAMQAFVQKYPKGGFTANAEYWLGELFFAKKDYSTAVAHFDVVLSQFPSSSKSAACLLKSGYAFAASGHHQEARKRLEQVVANYPNTPTAQLALSKLKTLNAL